MKLWQIGLGLIALIFAAALWNREPLALAYFAAKIEQTTTDERVSLLNDYVEIRAPDGDGPFPVVMQLHGCAGPRPAFHHQWADVANRAGYAAVIVDSATPRGFTRETALDIVCNGKALLGQERAGDIAAALKIIEQNPLLDASNVVLAGWSHGAWSVMDYLTMTPQTIPGIVDGGAAVASVGGAILFYPYCGIGARARFAENTQSPQTLTFIAGEDEIVDASQCIKHFEKRKRRGAPVEVVVYDGVNHVFDDPSFGPENGDWYDEAAFVDATKRFERFLVGLR